MVSNNTQASCGAHSVPRKYLTQHYTSSSSGPVDTGTVGLHPILTLLSHRSKHSSDQASFSNLLLSSLAEPVGLSWRGINTQLGRCT